MLVLRDRYLMLIALFVILLNCINSTGEFILADFVKVHAQAAVAAGEATTRAPGSRSSTAISSSG